MPRFPIAEDPVAALNEQSRFAARASEARAAAGRDVDFVVARLPGAGSDLHALDEKFGAQIADGVITPLSLPHGWAASIRFWRPAPLLPIGHSPWQARYRPIGAGFDAETARLALGVEAALNWRFVGRRHKSFEKAYQPYSHAIERGLARVAYIDGRWRVEAACWLPARPHWAAAFIRPPRSVPPAVARSEHRGGHKGTGSLADSDARIGRHWS